MGFLVLRPERVNKWFEDQSEIIMMNFLLQLLPGLKPDLGRPKSGFSPGYFFQIPFVIKSLVEVAPFLCLTRESPNIG